MTWNELSVLVATQLGRPHDYTLRLQLIDKAKLWRSRLIRDTVAKNPNQVNQHFYQSLYMPIVKAHLPTCVPDVLCPMYQSQYVVPMPVRRGNSLFDYLGSVDGKKPYRLEDGGAGSFLQGGRHAAALRFYRYDSSGIVQLFHNPQIILVRDIFDDPLKVISCNPETGESCDPYAAEIPLPGDILQNVIMYLTQEYAQQKVNGEETA
jgi:hypothetical protein